MRILICGSREWPAKYQHRIANRLDQIAAMRDPFAPFDSPIEFIVTGGARGVDEWADKAAGDRGLDRVVVPANWKRDGKAGGPIRNRRMASLLRPEAGDYCIAFRAHGESRGTDNMISECRRRGIPVEVIPPTGAVSLNGMGRAVISDSPVPRDAPVTHYTTSDPRDAA